LALSALRTQALRGAGPTATNSPVSIVVTLEDVNDPLKSADEVMYRTKGGKVSEPYAVEVV
jgi:hypothetical protein